MDEAEDIIRRPGIHLFVVGISEYDHLPPRGQPGTESSMGLHRLASPALTGYRFYRWLVEHKEQLVLPIATEQLLLAPSPQELEVEPGLADYVRDCSFDEFLRTAKQWRQEAANHPDSIAIFYFAGHGLQRVRKDHVMLMQDFADGLGARLRKAAETSSLYDGMAPTGQLPNMARKQLYFVDACRLPPELSLSLELQDASPVWDPSALLDQEAGEVIEDDRDAPLFFTTLSGAESYALQGKPSLFCQALIRCLDGGTGTMLRQGASGRDEWVVSDKSLSFGLNYHLPRVAREINRRQQCKSQWHGNEFALLNLPSPPTVEVSCEVEPEYLAQYTTVGIHDDSDSMVLPQFVVDPHPYITTLDGGRYMVDAIGESGNEVRSGSGLYSATPPSTDWLITLK
jgi:hypothetical protein